MNEGKILTFAIAGLVALVLVTTSVFTVQENQQVLVTRFGNPKDHIANPGLHFKLSFLVQAMATVYLLLPSFNLLVNKQLSLPVSEPIFWIASILIILFTGFVSGSYPAIYLSSFNPVTVLKGTILAGKKPCYHGVF